MACLFLFPVLENQKSLIQGQILNTFVTEDTLIYTSWEQAMQIFLGRGGVVQLRFCLLG